MPASPAPAPHPERIVTVGAVEIAVQAFGLPSDPTVLLVHGACASMLWWEDELCARLAAGRRHVVRFDNRDTGRSTWCPPGAPDYGLRDMAEDAIGVLDALSIAEAHLVGRSMAGAIVGAAAVAHPDRVASLTFVSTSPGDDDLPPMTDAFLAAVADDPPFADRAALLDHLMGVMRGYAGGPIDEEAVRALAERDIDRSRSIASALTNHFLIDLDAPSPAEVAVVGLPVMVVHGDRDPVWPVEHAHAMARHHPGSRLVVLPDTGHEVPPRTWPTFVDRLLRHTEPMKDTP